MFFTTIFFYLIPVLSFLLLGVNFIFAPHNPYKEKKTPFECGYHSFFTQNRIQFTISFFIFALLFLLFDLEIVLIYPLTVSSYFNTIYGFVSAFIFLLILVVGFQYELGKNALNIYSKQVQNIFNLHSSLYTISYVNNNKKRSNKGLNRYFSNTYIKVYSTPNTNVFDYTYIEGEGNNIGSQTTNPSEINILDQPCVCNTSAGQVVIERRGGGETYISRFSPHGIIDSYNYWVNFIALARCVKANGYNLTREALGDDGQLIMDQIKNMRAQKGLSINRFSTNSITNNNNISCMSEWIDEQ